MAIKLSVDDAARPGVRHALRLRPGAWPGLAAAARGLLFAVPGFAWAMGNTFGARTTVPPWGPWFIAGGLAFAAATAR
jgi:hypothetical protein